MATTREALLKSPLAFTPWGHRGELRGFAARDQKRASLLSVLRARGASLEGHTHFPARQLPRGRRCPPLTKSGYDDEMFTNTSR